MASLKSRIEQAEERQWQESWNWFVAAANGRSEADVKSFVLHGYFPEVPIPGPAVDNSSWKGCSRKEYERQVAGRSYEDKELLVSKTTMPLLFKVEDVFEIPGRGLCIVPAIPAACDFNIRAKHPIQLRTPDGHVFDTHIASLEFAKTTNGSRMAIMLPSDFVRQNVPAGTGVWLL